MSDFDPTQQPEQADQSEQSEHEKRVAEKMDEARGANRTEKGGLTGLTEPTAGDAPTTSYEEEVEAEKRGTTADELRDDERRDERTPLDSAYKPKTG